MRLTLLGADSPFPPVDWAFQEPDGLLAAGGDLSVPRLTLAYSNGIFPWFSAGEPIMWWSPDPRMVLPCADFSPGRALRKKLRHIERAASVHAAEPAGTAITVDTVFDQVIDACATARGDITGTWITPAMQHAYRQWHAAGVVHSIETWVDGELAGGLYGVSLGGMFFGESMFTRQTDASKIALAYLVRFLSRHHVAWIDCQQQTRHLASLGAAPVSRADFVAHVSQAIQRPTPPWCAGVLHADGTLIPH